MRKKYTSKFKAEAVLEVLREAQGLNEIAGRLQVHPNMLGRWKNVAIANLPMVFEDKKGAQEREHETQVLELYAQIGELTSKLSWLKKNLASTFCREERLLLLDKDDDSYSVKQQCELLSLNRSSLYYKPVPISEAKNAILRRIDVLYTLNPSFGGTTIGTILRREGLSISDPTVRSYMTQMGLHAVYPGPNLSKRVQQSLVYPYLLRNLAIEQVNQVWGTDITYIRMRNGFVYLVRSSTDFRDMWWHGSFQALSTRDLFSKPCATHCPLLFLISSTPTKGSQFTSLDYTALLKEKGVKISMDGRGRCMDNIFTEWLWRSLKYQEVYLNEYETPQQARDGIGRCFQLYNTF